MRIDVNFSEATQRFTTTMGGLDQSFDANFDQIQEVTVVNGVPYEGEYGITPKIESQVLPTKNKVMTDDLTIREIPIYETSNQSGGTTVYIAKEEY